MIAMFSPEVGSLYHTRKVTVEILLDIIMLLRVLTSASVCLFELARSVVKRAKLNWLQGFKLGPAPFSQELFMVTHPNNPTQFLISLAKFELLSQAV